MWPFTSSDKNTKELEQQLPDSLKDFFQKENPERKYEAQLELSKEEDIVSKAVAKSQKKAYSYEFEKYKRKEDIKKVAFVNCAELQQAVIDCLSNWKGTDLTFCDKEIKRNNACIDIQTKALKRLHYDDCTSIHQCKQIRYIVDELFLKNFGNSSVKNSSQATQNFIKEVDENFSVVWK